MPDVTLKIMLEIVTFGVGFSFIFAIAQICRKNLGLSNYLNFLVFLGNSIIQLMVVLKANLYVNPLQYRQTIGLGAASMDIGNGHRICDELRGLKLSRWPYLYQYIPSYEAILFNSKNLIDD